MATTAYVSSMTRTDSFAVPASHSEKLWIRRMGVKIQGSKHFYASDVPRWRPSSHRRPNRPSSPADNSGRCRCHPPPGTASSCRTRSRRSTCRWCASVASSECRRLLSGATRRSCWSEASEGVRSSAACCVRLVTRPAAAATTLMEASDVHIMVSRVCHTSMWHCRSSESRATWISSRDYSRRVIHTTNRSRGSGLSPAEIRTTALRTLLLLIEQLQSRWRCSFVRHKCQVRISSTQARQPSSCLMVALYALTASSELPRPWPYF